MQARQQRRAEVPVIGTFSTTVTRGASGSWLGPIYLSVQGVPPGLVRIANAVIRRILFTVIADSTTCHTKIDRTQMQSEPKECPREILVGPASSILDCHGAQTDKRKRGHRQ